MTDKELRQLKRYELLEMMVAQGKKIERLERELAQAKEELEQRRIAVETSGTMAEAALRLNKVFEDADRAAEQYLANVRAQADEILSQARQQANQITKASGAPEEEAPHPQQ